MTEEGQGKNPLEQEAEDRRQAGLDAQAAAEEPAGEQNPTLHELVFEMRTNNPNKYGVQHSNPEDALLAGQISPEQYLHQIQQRAYESGWEAALAQGVSKRSRRDVSVGGGFNETTVESLNSVELGETAKGELYVKSLKVYAPVATSAVDQSLDEYYRLRKRIYDHDHTGTMEDF